MLAVTTKYAISALRALAEFDPENYIQVKDLSKLVSIPGPYLSKVIKTLAIVGIVDTRRGLNGGVRLPLKKRNITYHDVCIAMDDPILNKNCILSKRGCNSANPCVMHEKWKRLQGELTDFLTDANIEI